MRGLLLLSAALAVACRSAPEVPEVPPAAPAVSTSSQKQEPVPACRLDGSQAEWVREAFDALRTYWTQEGPRALPWRQVAVNEAGSDGTLQIQLVTDAFEDQVDGAGCHKAPTGKGRLDPRSITGVCQVAGPASLHCSANAVRALIESEPRGRHPNPALVLLLAHEVSHLVHKDPRATYTSALRSISRSAPDDVKWKALVSGCSESNDPGKLERETRADAEALELIERFVKASADADKQAAPADVSALMLGSFDASLTGLRRWQAGWFGRLDLPPIETPEEGDDPEALARWAADRWLCQALEPGEGTLLVPQVAADHPIASVRLARLTGRVARMVAPNGGKSLLEDIGNAQGLLHRTALAFAHVNEAQAKADVLRTRRFCESARKTRAPDCARIPAAFPRAEKRCPEIDAHVTWKPLSPQGESTTASAKGNHLRVEVPAVYFARPLSDGTVLLGAHGRLGFLSGTQLTLYDVPCLPRDAVETPEGALVACDHSLGLVRTSRRAPVAFGRASVIFLGEPDVDNSRLDWIGQMGARTFALFRFGSGTSQTIDVTSDRWTTAMPWQGQGCERLVHGMALGLIEGRPTGTTQGRLSIHRTARFDDALTKFIDLTARSNLDPLACGLGPSSPLCLTPDGQLVDPEPATEKTVARLDLGDLISKRNLRSAALCTAGGKTYALVQVLGSAGNFIVQVHEVSRGKSRRLLREEWTDEAALRCTGKEATVSVSTGLGTRIWRFGTAVR